jgi:hypothetical protein
VLLVAYPEDCVPWQLSKIVIRYSLKDASLRVVDRFPDVLAAVCATVVLSRKV